MNIEDVSVVKRNYYNGAVPDIETETWVDCIPELSWIIHDEKKHVVDCPLK